jgi:hypothetical protein
MVIRQATATARRTTQGKNPRKTANARFDKPTILMATSSAKRLSTTLQKPLTRYDRNSDDGILKAPVVYFVN